MKIPFKSWITPATTEVWELAKRHRVLSSVLSFLVVVLLAFGAYVGFAQVVALVVPIAAIGYGFLRLLTRGKQVSRPAESRLIVASAVLATVVTAALIQAVPYGRDHSNPPVTGEPQWADPRTRELMVRACFGCHSNQVEYPSYASIAPLSWMVQSHIDEGRSKVNYSEFATNKRGMDHTIRVILNGSMPPSYYSRFGRHPEARLTDAEIETLVAGLRQTPGLSGGEDGGGRGGDDDDD